MENREKLEEKIGFDRILSMTEGRCSTSIAKGKVADVAFLTDFEEIESKLSQTDEMRVICMFESSFPDSGYIDTLPFLKQLESHYSFLDTGSIVKLKQSLETIRGIVSFFKNTKEGLYPNLKKLAEPVVLFPEITRRIEAIIDKFGDIRDNASPELMTIRGHIREKEGLISRRINSILRKIQSEGLAEEDATVSVRDGRMLIPVSVANKKKVPGFIYDESASGKTAFIEPMEIVELNNQVRELHFAEQREIQKILIEFSDFLRPYVAELITAADFLGEIDFIRAKALVAIQIKAGKPVLSKDMEMNLQKGRHPLLEIALKKEGKEIVPLTLSLNKEKHILLISGPNAGGKSVCLKTVGLLQYMLQCGFLISASESSELGIFRSVFIDIGDEQSIENDLSTYSSHLKNMRDMLSGADGRSLVLIDEFGAGTEPTAGGAIAEAILEQIEEKGAFGVITTHYSNLKFYASSSKGVINGGMQFDVQNIRPLFKLEIGTPGSSFAFELARKMGLPESVVKSAEQKAGSDFVDLEKHLKKIARNRRQWEERLAKIKSTDKTLENITDKYQKELSDIQALKKSIITEAKEEAKRLLSDTNKKIEATIKEIRESQAEKERTKELRKELEGFSKELQSAKQSQDDEKIARKMEQLVRRKERREEKKTERENRGVANKQISPAVTVVRNEPLKAGDKVKVKGGDLVGEIIRVDNNDISVAIGNIISKMAINKVERISNNEYQTVSKSQVKQGSYQNLGVSERKLNFKPSIDVRGQRLDEALDNVTHFIDDALMLGFPEVKILHGKGSGILKEELRKYLRTIGGVVSVKDEILELGGSGITVVALD